MAGFLRGGNTGGGGAGYGRVSSSSGAGGAGGRYGGGGDPYRDARPSYDSRPPAPSGGAGFGGAGFSGRAPPPPARGGGAGLSGTPPPAPSYGNEKAHAGGRGGGHLVVKCPDPLVLSNCLVVNGQEWGSTQYIMVDGRFVFTAL